MVEKLASLRFMKNKFISITIAVLSLCSIASPVKALNLSISELVEGAHEVMGGTYGMGGDSQGTRIPILAPSQLATDASLYWRVSKRDTGYEFTFGYTPTCNGATACNWGAFSAEKGGQMPDFENNSATTSESVTLSKGKKGLYRFYRSASYHAYVHWKESGVLYTAYIKNGRKDDVIAMANSAIDPRGSAQTSSVFNAEIIDPPTNCRSNPGSDNSVQQVLQRGDVLIDRENSAVDIRGNIWYREKYLGCWIHQSQLQFK